MVRRVLAIVIAATAVAAVTGPASANSTSFAGKFAYVTTKTDVLPSQEGSQAAQCPANFSASGAGGSITGKATDGAHITGFAINGVHTQWTMGVFNNTAQ